MNEILTLDGDIFATNFNRVVHGKRGNYVEFEEHHIKPLLVNYFEPTKKIEDLYYIWKTPVYKCRILEDTSESYVPRTYRNASADITLICAIDLTTSGEKCTYNAIKSQNKLYAIMDKDPIEEVIKKILSLNKSSISINIAGNGIYTFSKHGVPQYIINNFVQAYLERLISSLNKNNVKVSLIRSGGQTGADEAGILAAIKLGIPALIVCPNGYRYRTENENIANKETFCKRFPYMDQDIKVYHQLKTVAYADYKIGKFYVSPDQFLNFKDPEQLF